MEEPPAEDAGNAQAEEAPANVDAPQQDPAPHADHHEASRVAPSETGESLTEASHSQSHLSGVDGRQGDAGAGDGADTQPEPIQEGDPSGEQGAGEDDHESLGGEEDFAAIDFRPASNQVFRSAVQGAENEEDANLFIQSSAGPPPEEPQFIAAPPPEPEAPPPPPPPEPPARDTTAETAEKPYASLTGIGDPNIPDEDAPFGGLLPPPNLTMIRKKPGRGPSKPSKNYPEISGPSLTILRAATAPPPQVATRRGMTAREIEEATQRAQRLSGELLGKNGRYVGNLRGGVPHGKGQLWLPTGPGRPERLSYEGDWAMGLQTGFGTLHFANGEEYNGEVDKGQMHGRGRYLYRNGDVFQGTWVRGRRSGEGRLQYAGGDIFVGTFDGAERRGFGVYYYVSKGCKLEGDWVGDKALCGTVQNLSPEETALLNAAAEDWARSDIPQLRLAQPNRALFDALATLRPADARTGRELSAHEMQQLRHAFARMARGEEPGKGIRAEDLRRVLRESGVAASLAEADLDTLTSLLEGTALGGRIELDPFLGVIVSFRAEHPAVGLQSAAAAEEARAARRAAGLGGSLGATGRGTAGGGKSMGGTVRAVSPVRMEALRRTMRESMAYSGRK